MKTEAIAVSGTIGDDNGKPVLRVKGLKLPLTLAQLLHLVVGGKPLLEAPACSVVSSHGLPCLKAQGHKDKHHYVRKVYGKKRAAAIAPKPAEVHHPSSAASKRRAKGLCAWCDNKPAEGKKLCADHLVGARKQQKKMISKRKAA